MWGDKRREGIRCRETRGGRGSGVGRQEEGGIRCRETRGGRGVRCPWRQEEGGGSGVGRQEEGGGQV